MNSRQIKFRFWSPAGKAFIKEYKYSGLVDELFNEKDFDTLIPQQFTGLKDKNGKDIYEGDVIRGYFDMGPAGMAINTAIVRWTNKEGYQWNYWDVNTLEVIGNIFENPELLKL